MTTGGETEHEIVVLGGGLAGLTAALFAARQGRSTLLLEAAIPGGQLVNIEKIEDFPGFPQGIAGFELGPLVQEQAAAAGAQFALAEAQALSFDAPFWRVETAEGGYRARAVIVAVGSQPRPLGVPGEERLFGRGVSHCASCDGPLFRGKTVGVVGGGDSALQEALTLAGFAERVLLFHRGAALSAQAVYQERARATPAIDVRFRCVVEEVLGEETVSGARLADQSVVELAGLFPYVGLQPRTAFLAELLRLDGAGHVPTDGLMRTERPGLFAAGDVREHFSGQAVSAAGDGAAAAIAAHRYLQT